MVREYIRLGLFFYYKKIDVVNVEHVPKKGAVLFLANHQNALLDALLIATKSGRFSYFLTRASVFNNAFFSSILKSLQMIPVYRIRDGWNNLSRNNAIFRKSATLLNESNAIVIFPEGSHNINRTVRSLSKGFTRIIFETFERYPEVHLQLVPVGLNFVQAERFGDSASLYFGSPISITSNAIANGSITVEYLRQTIFDRLCGLTTHIDSENYDDVLKKLKQVNVDFLKPELVNRCIAENFKNCEVSKTKDFSKLKRFFKFWLIVALILPYLIWKFGVQPKIKEVEFRSTFRFAVAISLVPIYMLAIFALLFVLYGLSWALMYLFSALVIALLSIKL